MNNLFRKIWRVFQTPVRWPFILICIVILITVCHVFYQRIENYFVFFPQSNFDFTPGSMKLDHRDVSFRTEDGLDLHGWFFPNGEESPVILFCHGNAGNISHRLDNVQLLLAHGLRVFLFDYRGYGKSEGRPSEEGLYRDGAAAYDYLIREENIQPSSIIAFGRSLGVAVAIDLAGKREVRSLIIESGFTSIRGMAGSMILFSLISPLVPAHYNNIEKIAPVEIPKLVIHGDRDELIPFSMGKELFEAAREPKYFYKVPEAGHNDTYITGGEKYIQNFTGFVRDSAL